MIERERAVRHVRHKLQQRASARVHMIVLVTVTSAVGLLASYLLLHAGVRSMAVRYPLATGMAYAVFLGLVALWLRRFRLFARRAKEQSSVLDQLDVSDLSFDGILHGPREAPFEFGGGGEFSGSGGGASWGEVPRPIPQASAASTDVAHNTITSSGDAGFGWLDVDLDEGGVALIVAGVLGAVAFSVLLYVVWVAPALFAELLLDAGLAAGLFGRLSGIEQRPWLITALRQTAFPAVVVALLLSVAGTLMQRAYPDAPSIGPFVQHVHLARLARPAP
jgi:hypothetical protein